MDEINKEANSSEVSEWKLDSVESRFPLSWGQWNVSVRLSKSKLKDKREGERKRGLYRSSIKMKSRRSGPPDDSDGARESLLVTFRNFSRPSQTSTTTISI